MLTLTDATFDAEVLGSDTPVLVEFGSPDCEPCKQQLPILEEIERDHEGRLNVAKVDVYESTETARRFRIMAVPQVFLFLGGEPKARFNGFTPRYRIDEVLDEELS